jgi:5-methylcytosine-specific restriction protein A
MTPTALADAGDLILEVAERLRENGSGVADDDVLAALAATRELSRLVAQVQVEAVAELQRRGTFGAHGYSRPDSAVATMLTIDRGRAREIVRAADHVSARRDLQGQVLDPVLPAMADAFASGAASLQHVDLIARLMGTPQARRIPPYAWAGIEQHIAAMVDTYAPTELAKFADELVRTYDQDGAEPDDDQPEPVQVNELRVTPLPGGGGKIHGVFEDPVRFAMIATVLDAKSKPLTGHDQRSTPERAADALAEVCGYVLDHGNDVLPDVAGERPRLALTAGLTDLENGARAGCLDFGGILTPSALRMLCCDAGVIPIVMGGHGQPLDVGRERRIPTAIRRAVTTRDGGCAHPGCDRLAAWSEIHHIKEWARGGHTRLDNLVMLCRTHHREIHATNWQVRIARDGLPEFIPPAWLMKDQKPMRHPRLFHISNGSADQELEAVREPEPAHAF